jgi:hypothetical protein
MMQLARMQTTDPSQHRHVQAWSQALDALHSVDAKVVNQKALAQGLRGPAIGQALAQAQTLAIERQLRA